MGIPGMMLPQQQNPYIDDVGAQPMTIQDVLARLNPSLSNSQTMGNSNFSQTPVPGDFSVGGDPSTLSGRIQQALGAKPADAGGQIQAILAGRFQPPAPTFQDIGNSAIQTLQTGQYVPAQNAANTRLASSFDTLDKLSAMQEKQAQANYYNAVAGNGGGRGEGLAAAMRIMNENNSDPTKAPIGFTQAYLMATAKQGQGMTVDPATGKITTMDGAPQAAETMSNAKQTGTENAKIAGAAGIAEQGKIGDARGDAEVTLSSMQANLPALNTVVSDLHNLGQIATYTQAGQGYNTALRQMGLPMPDPAVARAQFISKVDNVLIPTLKAYFGPRVTNFDLQQAKNIMVNPDLAPEEKEAQLKAFIQQKTLTLQSQKRNVQNLGGQMPAQTEDDQSINQTSGQTVRTYNPQTGELE